MNAASTVLAAYTVTPKTSPRSRSHRIWYTSALKPERNTRTAVINAHGILRRSNPRYWVDGSAGRIAVMFRFGTWPTLILAISFLAATSITDT
jgi:hypothetical protein